MNVLALSNTFVGCLGNFLGISDVVCVRPCRLGLKLLAPPKCLQTKVQQTLILFNFFESIMVTWLAKMIWIWDLVSGSSLHCFHVCV